MDFKDKNAPRDDFTKGRSTGGTGLDDKSQNKFFDNFFQNKGSLNLNDKLKSSPSKAGHQHNDSHSNLQTATFDKTKLQDYDEAIRSIKDATGVSDVNEII